MGVRRHIESGVAALGDLRWPEVLPVVAAVLVLALLWWARHSRSGRPSGALLVAGTDLLRSLPRFRALLRRRRALGAAQGLAAVLVLLGAGITLARPQLVEERGGAALERDVMLCLDASASMDDDNAEVVQEISTVVSALDGDRVGLVVWSGAATLVFPLTDDADFVLEQLEEVERSLTTGQGLLFAGVDPAARRASLIGDGLVSCVERFDRPDEQRTRAVLLSSDNDPLGEPVYPLPDAAEVAADRDVVVYGIGAPDLATPARAPAMQQLAAAAEVTGGVLSVLGADGGADAVVERIEALEQARAEVRPRRVRYDAPGIGLGLAGLGVGLLLVTWVWRLREDPR